MNSNYHETITLGAYYTENCKCHLTFLKPGHCLINKSQLPNCEAIDAALAQYSEQTVGEELFPPPPPPQTHILPKALTFRFKVDKDPLN